MVQNGQIVESGRHQELVTFNGIYAGLLQEAEFVTRDGVGHLSSACMDNGVYMDAWMHGQNVFLCDVFHDQVPTGCAVNVLIGSRQLFGCVPNSSVDAVTNDCLFQGAVTQPCPYPRVRASWLSVRRLYRDWLSRIQGNGPSSALLLHTERNVIQPD